ncbi:DUF4062 domain-containing protein [candidate division KSB1 bacterium]|nr:DUF4062 domain-containing protein [candidate division KSB1 bacterium]
MPRTYKVYISSTYKDLSEQRKLAAQVALEMSLLPIAMEDYSSTEEKPVDKCCNDVKCCDIFIGIYAFRYGYVPDGYDKSITHLEYEAAGLANIPRLIFIIDDEAPWPRLKMDQDLSEIDEFRNLLRKNHTSPPIKDINQLKSAITTALHHTINNLPQENTKSPHIPPILPYLSNRSIQKVELSEIVCDCEYEQNQKPLFAIIHGDEQECHDTFLKQLQNYLLPDLLNLPADQNSVELRRLSWPDSSLPFVKRITCLESEFFQLMTRNRKKDVDLLIRALNASTAPLMIYSTIHAGEWQDKEPDLIHQWLKFWEQLPDLAVGKKIFVFFVSSIKISREWIRNQLHAIQN